MSFPTCTLKLKKKKVTFLGEGALSICQKRTVDKQQKFLIFKKKKKVFKLLHLFGLVF